MQTQKTDQQFPTLYTFSIVKRLCLLIQVKLGRNPYLPNVLSSRLLQIKSAHKYCCTE